jgi:hypothetical protein
METYSFVSLSILHKSLLLVHRVQVYQTLTYHEQYYSHPMCARTLLCAHRLDEAMNEQGKKHSICHNEVFVHGARAFEASEDS